MRVRRPSPAMVVACIALFVALGGTSVAAVNFARNAGAVDGKSAVHAGTTTTRAAGKLVATNRDGVDKGRVPGKFVADVPHTESFERAIEVADNAPGAPVTISTSRIGNLTATCNDQNARPGVEDAATTVSFVNTAGTPINVARRIGNGDGGVGVLAPGTVSPLTIRGSNSFIFHAEVGGRNVLVDGVVRQDGAGTPAAVCVFYGTESDVS